MSSTRSRACYYVEQGAENLLDLADVLADADNSGMAVINAIGSSLFSVGTFGR